MDNVKKLSNCIFRNGWTSVPDEECSGLPNTSTTEWNTGQECMLILNNRRVTIENVASKLQINHVSAYEIVHHRLNFCKVTARWVLKELKKQNMHIHLDTWNWLFNQYREDGDAILSCIFIGERAWIHYYNKWHRAWNGNNQHPLPKRSPNINKDGKSYT